MAYVDISTLMTIATGQPLPAAVVQQIRDNEEFLVDPPACSIYESTLQSILDNTATAVTSNEENFDNDSMHSTSTNTSRITVQTDGRYLCVAFVRFASNSTGIRRVLFRVDGTTSYDCGTLPPAAGASTVFPAVKPLVLTAGQYVEVMALQTSTGNLDVRLDDFSVFWMTR